jgi:hypothetical protein
MWQRCKPWIDESVHCGLEISREEKRVVRPFQNPDGRFNDVNLLVRPSGRGRRIQNFAETRYR